MKNKAYYYKTPKTKREYKTKGLRWYQQQRKALLKDPNIRQYYNEIKERFRVADVKENALRNQGLEGQEILDYYVREYQILTGSYELFRNKQFIDNYINAMRKAGVNEEIINQFEQVVTLENINAIVHELSGDISLARTYYMTNNEIQQVINEQNEDKRLSGISQIEDNIKRVLDNIKKYGVE